MRKLIPGVVLFLAAASVFGIGQRETGDFNYDGVRTLIVEAETFDIRVATTSGSSASMAVDRNPGDYAIYHERSGDTLRVWVERRFSLFSVTRGGMLAFAVPRTATLEIETSTGGVWVEGSRADTVTLKTSTGGVEATNMASRLAIATSTGPVSVRESVGDLTVRTTTGRIRVESSRGSIETRSSTGSQHFLEVDGTISAGSSTGRILLERVHGTLAVRTSTGSQIGTDVRLIGDSSFEASTGRIEMKLSQPLDEIEFDLRSSTGSLQVDGERSQRRLFLGGAGIRISGSTSTGSQIYTSTGAR